MFRKSWYLMFVAALVATTLNFAGFQPSVVEAAGCPNWGDQPMQMDGNGVCHAGPFSEPKLGGVAEGWYAEFWNDQAAGIRYAPSGAVFYIKELSLKRGNPPDGNLIDTPDVPNRVIPCPTFAGHQTHKTEPDSSDCKLNKLAARAEGTVAVGWSFEFWDDDAHQVRTVQSGETVKADEGTYHLVDAQLALGNQTQVNNPPSPPANTQQPQATANGCPTLNGVQLENIGVDPQRGTKCKLWSQPQPVQYMVGPNVSVDYLDAGGGVHLYITSGTLLMREATLYIK